MLRSTVCVCVALLLTSCPRAFGQSAAVPSSTARPATTTTVAQVPAQAAVPVQPPRYGDAFDTFRAYNLLGQQAPMATVPAGTFQGLYGVVPDSNDSARLPYLVLHSELSADERKLLIEDLQVLSALLVKAVGETGDSAATDTALGLAVSRSGAGNGHSIEYQQDSGIVARFTSNTRVFAPQEAAAEEPVADAGKKEESAWDAARRDLFERQEKEYAPQDVAARSWLRRTRTNTVTYDKDQMSLLMKRVEEVLANVDRIHFPTASAGKAQSVTVILRSSLDGSVTTLRTTAIPEPVGTGVELSPVTTYQYFDRGAMPATMSVNGADFVPYSPVHVPVFGSAYAEPAVRSQSTTTTTPVPEP